MRRVLAILALLLVALAPVVPSARADSGGTQPFVVTVHAPKLHPARPAQVVRRLGIGGFQNINIALTCSPTTVARNQQVGCYVNYWTYVPSVPTIRLYWADGWVTTISFPYGIHQYANTFYHSYVGCGSGTIVADAQDPVWGEVAAYSPITVTC